MCRGTSGCAVELDDWVLPSSILCKHRLRVSPRRGRNIPAQQRPGKRLRAEIGRFDRFDTGKQLSRFCGVTPRNASSGNRQADAGLIKAAIANRWVRWLHHELRREEGAPPTSAQAQQKGAAPSLIPLPSAPSHRPRKVCRPTRRRRRNGLAGGP